MQVQSAMSWPCVCNFLCLAVTALWYFEKVQWNFLLAMTSRYIYIYIYILRCACYCLLSPELWHNCLLMIKWLVWLCSKLMKNFEIWMSWGNPSTNQLTEKKQSKTKTPYRPLQRREPLKRKAGWKTEAQSVKEVLRRKRSPTKYQWEQKPLWLLTRSWVEEGLRECHMKNQLEEIEALRSANKQPPRRIGQKRPKKQPEKAAVREERCPWKRTSQPWKKTSKKTPHKR